MLPHVRAGPILIFGGRRPVEELAQGPVFKALVLWDDTSMKKETQPLNLSTISQKKLKALYGGGYIARKWGAVWGMPAKDYWTLTAMGENVWHLV